MVEKDAPPANSLCSSTRYIVNKGSRFCQLDSNAILDKFEYMDADGSGAIEFEEFVSVMTSDMRGQEFFRLADEKEAARQSKAFFEFATVYVERAPSACCCCRYYARVCCHCRRAVAAAAASPPAPLSTTPH